MQHCFEVTADSCTDTCIVRKGPAGESDGYTLGDINPMERDSDFSDPECAIIFSPGRNCREHRLGMACPFSASNTKTGCARPQCPVQNRKLINMC